jgi:dipeptide transport system substrate-binding protein
MRLSVKKTAWALAVLTATTLVNTAWASGTLVYCSETSPTGFDAAQLTSGSDFDAVSYTMFDNLVAYKPGTAELIPRLAEKWTISHDGKTYTFYLRPNVQFHTTDYFKPTRPMQAEDVIFSFGRMIKRDHPSNVVYPAEYPLAANTGINSNIISIKKIDKLTVEFKLKEADTPFLTKFGVPFAVIHSVEYAQQLANKGRLAELNQKPIGTGPFVFGSYTKDEAVRYTANRAYWNPEAIKLDKLIFSIVKDPSVRYQKLQRGECDIISAPNPADIAEIKQNPALKLATAPGFNVGYLSYNVEKPELKKLAVRQALDMAINREAILESVFRGQGQLAVNPFPPILWSYNTQLKNAPFNPTKAKQLLAEAGYPNGFETDLWAMPVQRPTNPNAKLMAEMIQADWAKIGVKTKIVTFEWGEYLKRLKQGEHMTALMGWTGAYADPDAFMGILFVCQSVGGTNYSRYCSQEYDALVSKAARSHDVAERTKLYEQAQAMVKRDLPWTIIAHSKANQPMRKSVQGFTISPFSNVDFRYVSKSE